LEFRTAQSVQQVAYGLENCGTWVQFGKEIQPPPPQWCMAATTLFFV